MRDGGIRETAKRIGLDLKESEKMACEIMDILLNDDIVESMVDIIETAFEHGQDVMVESMADEMDTYISLEKEKIRMSPLMMSEHSDPEIEKRFRFLVDKQSDIEEMMQSIFEEDVKLLRMKNGIYMKIGEVEAW